MSKKGIIIIFAVVSIFLFVNGVSNFGYVSGSEFVHMGILLLCLLLIALAAFKIINYLAEERVFIVLYCVKSKMRAAEIISVSILLLISLTARIVAAFKVKVPEKDTEFLHSDVLFPAKKLYQDILGVFQGFAGSTVTDYEIFNILVSVVSLFLIYLIVKSMYGRSGGLTALLISALWPAHILGVVYNDDRYFCTMLFLAVVYFFLMFRKTKYWPVFSCLAGVALGVLMYMQTTMYVLLVLFLISPFIKGAEGKNRTFGGNFIKRIPAVAVSLAAAFLVIGGINGSIASKLDVSKSEITGINGYAIMTGLNAANIGNENEKDYQFLMNSYEEGHNAKDAQYVCIWAAKNRFDENVTESFNLILKKAQYIFGGDHNLKMNKDMGESYFVYLEEAYYLLILMATGIFAVEFLLRNHRGNINFIIVTGILIVISGALFMVEEAVQMQFGYIMTICSGAVVSIVYRRGLGYDADNKAEEETDVKNPGEKKTWRTAFLNFINSRKEKQGYVQMSIKEKVRR